MNININIKKNKVYYFCYNLRLSNKSEEEPCIEFIQDNLIKFLVQSIYLIYTKLIVHTIC